MGILYKKNRYRFKLYLDEGSFTIPNILHFRHYIHTLIAAPATYNLHSFFITISHPLLVNDIWTIGKKIDARHAK